MSWYYRKLSSNETILQLTEGKEKMQDTYARNIALNHSYDPWDYKWKGKSVLMQSDMNSVHLQQAVINLVRQCNLPCSVHHGAGC